jgi:FkbM family methyltransferase
VQLGRRIRHIFRVHRHDGFLAIVWEFLFQILKPFLRAYERLLWHWYLRRRRSSFEVLGSNMTVLRVDEGVSRELAIHRIHEPLATSLIEQHVRPGMTVVEVGANIGYYALLETRLVGSGGKVIAIEPVPRNVEGLRRNVRNNGRTNIEVHQLAIADRNGTLPMYLSARSNWHSLLPTPSAETCMVPVSTLDDFLFSAPPDSVDLIRMDVEGYEIEIIKGMQRVLSVYDPYLLIEIHPDVVGSQAIIDYLHTLENLGYAPQFVFEQERDYAIRWKFLKPEKPTMRELMGHPLVVRDQRALTVLFSRSDRRQSQRISSSALLENNPQVLLT